jgi:type II secretory pathway component PulF
MFRSFDLEVPALTSLLILLSHLVRDYGLIVASLIVLSGLAAWGGAWWQEKYGEGSWRSRLLARYRSDLESLADWASQVAALIDAGLSQPDAIRTAGDASEKQWLSDTSQAWSETVRGGGTPKDEFLYIRGRACHLLAYALQLPDAEQQSAMLGEVSRIYRGRDQQRSGWWIDWFAQASVVVVGVAVGFVVLALFLPLVSLVSGLT